MTDRITRKGGSAVWVLCLLLALAGCKPAEIEVQLSEQADLLPAPVFRVSGGGPGERTGWIEVRVLDLSGPCDRAGCPVVWAVRAAVASEGPRTFRYGATPPGFATPVEAQPLTPGGRYQLLIRGGRGLFGLLAAGELIFEVSPQGRLFVPGEPKPTALGMFVVRERAVS